MGSAAAASVVPRKLFETDAIRTSGFFQCGLQRRRGARADALTALLTRTQNGDRDAACALLRRLRPPLRRYLRRTLTSVEDLEDTLQDTLLAVLNALPGFRGDASLLHFAIQIAHRSALARRRRIRRHDDRSARLARLVLPLVPAPSGPHESSLEERRHVELMKLLHELPTVHAETVTLAIVAELSLAEIADSTGACVNTVRSRLSRARRWLRSRIESDPVLTELFVRG